MNEPKKIAFKVELSRILELLADQIYQSPLALLRENTQNAFDAIRMRLHLGHDFAPQISVQISDGSIIVSDNGIGMTPAEIEQNFWYAGASGKNNPEARAAGVVGTFGIGAMANFGIAAKLSVESQSARSGERTFSAVAKEDLSTDEAGIEVSPRPPGPEPGTTVIASLDPSVKVSVDDAIAYLREFVEFVDLPVLVNGQLLSEADYSSALPSTRFAWEETLSGVSLAGLVEGDLRILGMASGELRVILEDGRVPGMPDPSRAAIVLWQGGSVLRTLRTGFGLATVAVSSLNQWGGIVDLPFLLPTAGREALEVRSNQQLQNVIASVDQLAFQAAAAHDESFNNDSFLRWLKQTGRFDLCGRLEVNVRPSGEPVTLDSLVGSAGRLRFYAGRDPAVVATFASEDEPLIVISRTSPRRDCELGYVQAAGIAPVDESPQVLEEFDPARLSLAYSALAARASRLLEEDYFLPATIGYGDLSGGLAVLVKSEGPPVSIFLDPSSTTVAPLLALYNDDFNAFGPFVKDFVRSHIFPRVSSLVPSSTREGAEAFLRRLQAKREWFEYDTADQRDLDEIWDRFKAGELSLTEATDRMTDRQRSVVEVSRAQTASVGSVVRTSSADNVDEEADEEPDLGPRPGIDRRTELTAARILTTETPIDGHGCFLALSDRAQREKGDFFLQPHTTEIVWGGQKVLFVFQHHSRRFGLYYDVLCPGLVSSASGGGQFVTSTILTSDRVFIPVPAEISEFFLPESGVRIKLEIKCDVIYLNSDSV